MHDPKNPNSGTTRKAYTTPSLRSFGSLSELTRSAGSMTTTPLDNTTRTKTNRSA